MLNIKKICKLVFIAINWLSIFIFICLFPIQIALAAPQVKVDSPKVTGVKVARWVFGRKFDIAPSVFKFNLDFGFPNLSLFRTNYYLESDETKNKTQALKQQYEEEPVIDYINGIDASQEGDFKKAIGYFSDAVRKDGDFAEAYVARGRVYSQWGDNHLEEAIRSYTDALEKPPKFAPDPSRFVEPLLGRAAVYRKLGKDKAALDDLNRVIQKNPDFYDAYLARADIYTKNNDTKDVSNLGEKPHGSAERHLALKDLDTAIYLKPDYPAALLARGLIQVELGNDTKALSDFLDVTNSQEPDAAAYYNDAWYNLGLIYLRLGKDKQAIQAFSSAVKPNKTRYDFKHYADAYYYRGLLYSKQESYAEAVEDFEQTLNYNPQYPVVYYPRGLAYLNIKEYQKSLEDLNKEISRNPKNFDPYYYRGYVNLKLDNWQQSVTDYTKVISSKPNFAPAYNKRCISYFVLNNFDRAIEDCEKAISLNPNLAEAYFTLGRIYNSSTDYQKAIRNFIKGIENKINFTERFTWLDKNYANQRNSNPKVKDFSFAYSFHTSNHFSSMAISPDGKTLASTGGYKNKLIFLHDLATGREIKKLSRHSHWINTVAFSPDGKTIASGSDDKTVKLWNVKTGQKVFTLKGHDSDVESVAFSPDGKTIASGSDHNTVKLWDIKTGQLVCTLSGHVDNVRSLAFSLDGDILASGSNDSTVRLWDIKSGNCPPSSKLILAKHSNRFWVVRLNRVRAVAFSPDGETLISAGNDKTIRLWNFKTGKIKQILSGHTDNVTSLAVSNDGKLIASGSDDKTVKIWDLSTGKELQTLTRNTSYVQSVAFSPDGKTLVSGGYAGNVLVWRSH